METLASRLKWLQEQHNLSVRAMAAKAGISEGGLRAIFREESDSATLRTIRQLAEAFDINPSWLAFAAGQTEDEDHAKGVPVLGAVAAGAWFAVHDSVDAPRSNKFIAADPRFERRFQYGLTVHGESMNELVSDGDELLCLDYRKMRKGPLPRDRDLVIVEQTRDNNSLREVSAKLLLETPSGPILAARSTEPKWKDFVLRPTISADNDNTIVQICAIVLRSERGWWRE